MPAATSVNGAGIHTSAAADATKRIAKFFTCQDLATSIVDQDDMQFAAIDRAVKMGGVGRDGLTGRTAGEQA